MLELACQFVVESPSRRTPERECGLISRLDI